MKPSALLSAFSLAALVALSACGGKALSQGLGGSSGASGSSGSTGSSGAQCTAAPTCELGDDTLFTVQPCGDGAPCAEPAPVCPLGKTCYTKETCGATVYCASNVACPRPRCDANQIEVAGPESCSKSRPCTPRSNGCGLTIWCAPDEITCDGLPSCDPGDRTVSSPSQCVSGPGAVCYSRSVCGSTIWCNGFRGFGADGGTPPPTVDAGKPAPIPEPAPEPDPAF